MQPLLIIFCAFTRPWSVDLWLSNLAQVEHDPKRTSLCFIVDCDEPQIVNKLKAYADTKHYLEFRLKVNDDWEPNEVKLAIRRARIAEVKTQSCDLISQCEGDIVIGLEDDTVFDRLESFAPLYEPLINSDETIGFVEGVQMGRWGVNMIGAWKADNIQAPRKIRTLLPPHNKTLKLQTISAGGFYGYATRKQLYLDHEYFGSASQPWGPDVNYGIWLGRQGIGSLINWEVVFGHNDHGTIGYPDREPFSQQLAEVIYTKNEYGKWMREDHEKGRYA